MYALYFNNCEWALVADLMVKLLTKVLTKLANTWPNSHDLSFRGNFSLVVRLFHSVKSCSVWSCVLVKSCSVWLCVFFSLIELMFSLIMCFIHSVKSSLYLRIPFQVFPKLRVHVFSLGYFWDTFNASKLPKNHKYNLVILG
jgi:hypothetical protein